MIIYVIYRNPLDAPGLFVLRRWMIRPGSRLPEKNPVLVSCCLEEVRAAVPPGHFCHPRSPMDEPQVVEQWIPKQYEATFKQAMGH